jgi:hypothetical protein
LRQFEGRGAPRRSGGGGSSYQTGPRWGVFGGTQRVADQVTEVQIGPPEVLRTRQIERNLRPDSGWTNEVEGATIVSMGAKIKHLKPALELGRSGVAPERVDSWGLTFLGEPICLPQLKGSRTATNADLGCFKKHKQQGK